jgi:hypothetical protein
MSTATITRPMEHATPGERRVARALVRMLLEADCAVSVDDGGEFTVKRSRSFRQITNALATTGEDTLWVRDFDGRRLGFILLVWGNNETGEELIADYTASHFLDCIVESI